MLDGRAVRVTHDDDIPLRMFFEKKFENSREAIVVLGRKDANALLSPW